MKITFHEIIIIVLIVIMLAIGIDHLILRERIRWMTWQNEATVIINRHDAELKRVMGELKMTVTPTVESGPKK